MKTVEEHLAQILATVSPLAAIDLQLLEAHGCVLAEDVTAPTSVPSFDNSAMDGYAVRAADITDASDEHPVRLSVLGDVMAGSWAMRSVVAGSCLRIMTGAPLPAGADAVVPVEWTDGGVAAVRINRPAAEGNYIRRIGEDIAAGDVVAHSGRVLVAAQVGVLASVGRTYAVVRPKPRVVVMSTGDELVEPGVAPGPGQIVDANSYALAAAVAEAGCTAYRTGICPDDPERLRALLDDNLLRGDVVITSGGVSVGERDVVKKALRRLGTVEFERVAMQPGMPQGFGTLGPDDTPIFCLPGNPVSSLVSFEVFVRPALRAMAADPDIHRPVVSARLSEDLTSPTGRRQFRRGWVERADDGYQVRTIGGAGSHLLSALSLANALIVVPESTTEVRAGEQVDVLLLERAVR